MIVNVGKLIGRSGTNNKNGTIVLLLTNNTPSASFFFEYTGTVKIEWGDGQSEIVEAQNVAHVYADSRIRIVTIYTEPENLLRFSAGYRNNVLDIDTSKATNLRQLVISNNAITVLNVSANTELNRVEVNGNPLVLNDANLMLLAESLPDRTGQSIGTLRLINPSQAAKIQSIITVKNWQTT